MEKVKLVADVCITS